MPLCVRSIDVYRFGRDERDGSAASSAGAGGQEAERCSDLRRRRETGRRCSVGQRWMEMQRSRAEEGGVIGLLVRMEMGSRGEG